MDDINPQGTSESTVDTELVETPSEPEAQQEDSTPEEQPLETYDWGGRKVSAKELHEEARRLQSDYTKKSQKLSEYERIAQQEPPKPNPIDQLPPEERVQLEQVAKQLSPFLTPVLQDEVNKLVEQRLNASLQEKEQVQAFQKQFDEAEAMAKKAGVPFNREEMVEYMKSANNWNVMDAFKARNFDKLMDYQITQKKAAEKKPTTVTAKKPAPQEQSRERVKDITDTNFKQSLTQKLASMLGGE